MKNFVVAKGKLAEVAHNAVHAASATGNLNVSNFLKVRVDTHEVTASYINPDGLSVVSKEKIDNGISEPCEFLLDKNKAKNIQYLKGEDINVTLEDNTIRIASGDDNEDPSVWNTMDTALYPQIPALSDTPRLVFSTTVDELKSKYKFLKPGISDDETRPILCELLGLAQGNEIFLYALDGVRMHVNVLEMPQAVSTGMQFNIPTKLAEFLITIKGSGDVTFRIYNQVVTADYEDEGKKVSAFEKLVDGTAPDFRQILTKPEFSVFVNRGSLIESIERLMAFTNNHHKTHLLMTLVENSNKLTLRMENENEVNTDVVLMDAAAIKGLKIAFNHKLLMEALKSFGSESEILALGFTDALKQVLIQQVADDEIQDYPFAMVLPVRQIEK